MSGASKFGSGELIEDIGHVEHYVKEAKKDPKWIGHFMGVEQSSHAFMETIEKHGPFDGILAFS